MDERMDGWMNKKKKMDEWIKWMNEWMNEWMNRNTTTLEQNKIKIKKDLKSAKWWETKLCGIINK